MSYKIIADSCCEFPEEYKEDPRFVNIPLGLDVAGEHLWDDETFDQASFLQKVASSKPVPVPAVLLRRNICGRTIPMQRISLFLPFHRN